MRKVWIPKEALIPKPFYKQKLFVVFTLLLISSIMFLAYQLYFVNQLSMSNSPSTEGRERHAVQAHDSQLTNKRLVEINPKREFVKGIRIRDIDNYRQLFSDQKFRCLDKTKEIPWNSLNDDYCDCPDGSDETLTNACVNGKFYCAKQLRHKTGKTW